MAVAGVPVQTGNATADGVAVEERSRSVLIDRNLSVDYRNEGKRRAAKWVGAENATGNRR
jgi:hypothetical protein